MGKKIVVSMTFRSFDGSINDKIQRRFLQSVKNQTHQNFLLAVTVFGETNVPEALKEAQLPHELYYAPAGDYKKFSLTQVLLNGIRVSKEQSEDCILLWINADNMLEPDFFERIANFEGEKIGGILYPHVQYPTIEDYEARKGGTYGWYGIDSAFFSSDVFDDKFIEAVKNYPNNDYLYFEALVVALATVFCGTRINMGPTGYSTITNDYGAVNQTAQSTKATGVQNMRELKRFLHDFDLPDKDWYYLILNYKLMSKSPFTNFWMRILLFIRVKYAGSYLRHAMPKIKRLINV
jgi:hypothetical protein